MNTTPPPFSEDQLDALTEAVNIGVGRAAAALNSLVDRAIELRVPRVRVCCPTELSDLVESEGGQLDTSVVQGFSGAMTGRALLAFPEASGVALAKLVGDPDAEGDALEFDLAGVLEEIGNIVLNGVLGSLANLFEDDFIYTVPELYSGPATDALLDKATESTATAPTCLLADARFDVADSEVSGSLLLAFNTEELSVLLERLLASVVY